MRAVARLVLLSLRTVCVFAGYAFAGTLLLLVPNSRYDWMRAKGVVELPIDRESVWRVSFFASAALASLLLGWASNIALRNPVLRRSPVAWWIALPAGYAAWRLIAAAF